MKEFQISINYSLKNRNTLQLSIYIQTSAMVHNQTSELRNNQGSTISDPQEDLGLIPDVSVLEIKWCIKLENGDEMDVVREFYF